MSKEEVLAKVDRVIWELGISIQAHCSQLELAAMRDRLELFREIRAVIANIDKEKEEEYNKGLNDAWELAQRIGGINHHEIFNGTELEIIFGSRLVGDVFDKHSYIEALAKVDEYELRKSKPVRGDVVKVTAKDNTHGYTGVYLGQSGHDIFILVEERIAPVCLDEFDYFVNKTGERVIFEYKKIGDSND